MTAYSEPIDLTAPVDDLCADTGAVCARCGTGYELTRPNSLQLDGRFHGQILCEPCIRRESLRAELVNAASRNPVCRPAEGCTICEARRAP